MIRGPWTIAVVGNHRPQTDGHDLPALTFTPAVEWPRPTSVHPQIAPSRHPL